MSVQEAAIRENFERVQERMQRAAQRCGRDPSGLRLVVVTKTQPVEIVAAVVRAGAIYLGENYADEAAPKISALAESMPGAGAAWHMIGHVQSRKARLVCQHFQYVHSLDSLKLANRLEAGAAELGRILPVLLECNTSGETSKFGWPAWDESRWEELLLEFETIARLPHLQLRGLMTIGPLLEDAGLARPYYRRLRLLQAYLRRQMPHVSWDELSMGMSNDFETAIEEGATWVRVGRSILGPRQALHNKNV